MPAFDPYHKWLGIPPAEQPPNYYRLLGVNRFEADVAVISNAADQRMAFLKSVQTGEHGPLSQDLLNQVAQAKLCLLDVNKKLAYDATLRHQQTETEPPNQAVPSVAGSVLPPPFPDNLRDAERQHELEREVTFLRIELAQLRTQPTSGPGTVPPKYAVDAGDPMRRGSPRRTSFSSLPRQSVFSRILRWVMVAAVSGALVLVASVLLRSGTKSPAPPDGDRQQERDELLAEVERLRDTLKQRDRESQDRIQGHEQVLADVDRLRDLVKQRDRELQTLKDTTERPPESSPTKPELVAATQKLITTKQKDLGGAIVNSIDIVLVPIPAGVFMMGSPESEAGRRDNETQHRVQITQPFYLSVHEVTQAQYVRVMGNNPSSSKGDTKPVEMMSWNDAVEFCRKLSEQEGVEYRLPTEAEWEYACRAGTTTTYSFRDDDSQLGKYAWYGDNAGGETHVVGQKLPNTWGLYDINGNVDEWCQDWYAKYDGDKIDPTGPASGVYRVLRGGQFGDPPVVVRSAYRGNHHPNLRVHLVGCRLARTYDLVPDTAFPAVDVNKAASVPNAFDLRYLTLEAHEAGSKVSIAELEVRDMKTGKVYSYKEMGPTPITSNSATKVSLMSDNGFILECAGFGRNGAGGYNSTATMRFSKPLPNAFSLKFQAIKHQWPGHFRFLIHSNREGKSETFRTQINGGQINVVRLYKPVQKDLYSASGSSGPYQGRAVTYVMNASEADFSLTVNGKNLAEVKAR